MKFMERLEKGNAANFISLNEREKELYHGAGWYLAAVEQAEIVALKGIDEGLILTEELTDAIFSGDQVDLTAHGQSLLAWAEGKEVYLGMMSCFEFCLPERFKAALLARVSRLIVEQIIG